MIDRSLAIALAIVIVTFAVMDHYGLPYPNDPPFPTDAVALGLAPVPHGPVSPGSPRGDGH